MRVDSLPHRKWKEIKQQPGTAGSGNMLGCCLLSFHVLWAIHPIRPCTVEAPLAILWAIYGTLSTFSSPTLCLKLGRQVSPSLEWTDPARQWTQRSGGPKSCGSKFCTGCKLIPWTELRETCSRSQRQPIPRKIYTLYSARAQDGPHDRRASKCKDSLIRMRLSYPIRSLGIE